MENKYYKFSFDDVFSILFDYVHSIVNERYNSLKGNFIYENGSYIFSIYISKMLNCRYFVKDDIALTHGKVRKINYHVRYITFNESECFEIVKRYMNENVENCDEDYIYKFSYINNEYMLTFIPSQNGSLADLVNIAMYEEYNGESSRYYLSLQNGLM